MLPEHPNKSSVFKKRVELNPQCFHSFELKKPRKLFSSDPFVGVSFCDIFCIMNEKKNEYSSNVCVKLPRRDTWCISIIYSQFHQKLKQNGSYTTFGIHSFE